MQEVKDKKTNNLLNQPSNILIHKKLSASQTLATTRNLKQLLKESQKSTKKNSNSKSQKKNSTFRSRAMGVSKNSFQEKLNLTSNQFLNRSPEKKIEGYFESTPLKQRTTPTKSDPIKINQNISTENSALKNVNEYLQLVDVHDYPNKTSINWTMNLRNYKITDKKTLSKSFREPSFYQKDKQKFVDKKIKIFSRSRSQGDINIKNLGANSFIYKNKPLMGKVSLEVIKHNLNLREIPLKHRNDLKCETPWNNNTTYSIYKPNLINLPQTSAKSLEDKFFVRPYKKMFKNIYFLRNKIRQVNLVEDNKSAYINIGEHLGQHRYNDYYMKNYGEIYQCLNGKNTNNLNNWFMLSLRKKCSLRGLLGLSRDKLKEINKSEHDLNVNLNKSNLVKFVKVSVK